MASYLQKHRPLQVTTPLGEEALLVIAFRGTEQLSRLFSFELELIADNSTVIDFSKLTGGDITLGVATPGKDGATDWRFLSGICACFSQGNRNEEFTSYYAEVVPKVWLLTHRAQSRIFQQKSVPDILKEVLQGFDCDFQLRGQYETREYCVQYRETDFDFASRLMEEEGIYYFFQHSKGGHKMVIADTSQAHAEVPGLINPKYKVVEGGMPQGDHIFEWRKTQAVRASKYSLWDHSFQQPTQNLEAKASIMDSVQAGSVLHQLNGQANAPLEIYDFPGGYALRYDGVSPSGGDQSQRLQKILEDNKRTVKLRMEAETVQALTIRGTSGCRNFVAGHKFSLERHFDAEGDYVLVSVTHDGSLANPYRTGSNGGADLVYANKFTCIPFQLPYRPPFQTPKPFVHGVQNALVTGPAGEEIFTDKYGRVKVQFYWDRQGKKDANSSCWLRVSTYWAGKQWGAMQVPRIGQEVIVAFVEGNPDEPVIVGSVYNPVTMPPYGPGRGVISGLKSNTHKGNGYNEISMDDTAGKEKVTIHAQYDMRTTVEHDQSTTIRSGKRTLSVQSGTNSETIKSNSSHIVQAGYRKVEVTGGDYSATSTDAAVKLLGNGKGVDITGHSEGVTVTGTGKGITAHGTGGPGVEINGEPNFAAFGQSKASITSPDVDIGNDKITIHGSTSIELIVGSNSIKLDGSGISINGTKVTIAGGSINSSASGIHEIAGGMVKIN
jgi:type VI secretion system secreted protein VgrG